VGPLLRSLAITLILPATAVFAQGGAPPDTLPFHHGQWAAQFGAGTSFASLGFLRFTAPTRAWLFDFRFSGGHTHSTLHFGDTLTANDFTSSASASARLGRRFYQGRGKSVASFQSVGALGGYSHGCSGSSQGAGSCDNGWNAGVFVELGGVYLLTSRFSVGGSAAASLSYERDNLHESSGVNATRWAYNSSVVLAKSQRAGVAHRSGV
jgi:hypothetical protein